MESNRWKNWMVAISSYRLYSWRPETLECFYQELRRKSNWESESLGHYFKDSYMRRNCAVFSFVSKWSRFVTKVVRNFTHFWRHNSVNNGQLNGAIFFLYQYELHILMFTLLWRKYRHKCTYIAEKTKLQLKISKKVL